MPTNTHTTATVRLQLDLTGLISELRELADTLEAANVKRYDDIPKAADMDDPFGLAAANREAVADFPPGIAGDFPCCAPKADDDHEPEPVCTCPETTLVDDHEPDIPTACENCNTTYAGCDERLGRACCKPCEVRDTHKAVAWEMWRWQGRQARHERPAPTTTPLAAALQWRAGQ